MRVVVTAGPIPAKIDSVKIITNMFKGGLMMSIAQKLMEDDFDVTVVKWTGTACTLGPLTAETPLGKSLIALQKTIGSEKSCEVINVTDVHDYMRTMKKLKADAYIMGAAVANLMPSKPWVGKFPSHRYNVGEKFNIEFEIVPRIIDAIREAHGAVTLIGYKLFDGPCLVGAGREVLESSKANVVFCNRPETAKTTKIALTQDGAELTMDFDEHVEFIKRVINLEWYKTSILSSIANAPAILPLLLDLCCAEKNGRLFGTAAIKVTDGGRSDGTFFTSMRGKKDTKSIVRVDTIDHTTRTIAAEGKATLNAPALHALFARFPNHNCIVHGHHMVPDATTIPYEFPGTASEVVAVRSVDGTGSELADLGTNEYIFNIADHGYYGVFETPQKAIAWLKS